MIRAVSWLCLLSVLPGADGKGLCLVCPPPPLFPPALLLVLGETLNQALGHLWCCLSKWPLGSRSSFVLPCVFLVRGSWFLSRWPRHIPPWEGGGRRRWRRETSPGPRVRSALAVSPHEAASMHSMKQRDPCQHVCWVTGGDGPTPSRPLRPAVAPATCLGCQGGDHPQHL